MNSLLLCRESDHISDNWALLANLLFFIGGPGCLRPRQASWCLPVVQGGICFAWSGGQAVPREVTSFRPACVRPDARVVCCRWHNHLNPCIRKTPWTAEEDEIILSAHAVHGNNWSHIAKLLPGRYARLPRLFHPSALSTFFCHLTLSLQDRQCD